MRIKLTHYDLVFAYPGTNNKKDSTDLLFYKDTKNYIIKNVEPPTTWNGVDDWCDDDDYINQVTATMDIEQYNLND